MEPPPRSDARYIKAMYAQPDLESREVFKLDACKPERQWLPPAFGSIA